MKNRERRVALTPSGVEKLVADGHTIAVEVGAGLKAGFSDDNYRQAGASVTQRAAVVGDNGIVVAVNGPASSEVAGPDWRTLSADHTVIALHDPLWNPTTMAQLADTGATVVSLELVPRITRAQSMDVLSSMATVAGYQAVLLAATKTQKMWPLLMTAGGTIPPVKVLVIGAGVAGLQAIASARRLGAVVEAFDVRPAASEQIESLGAKAIRFDERDQSKAEDAGGYATKRTVAENQQTSALLAPHVAAADVVITTASVPGAPSPELIDPDMVAAMAPGSVIVDLAAERGGNCRLTKPDDEVQFEGVTIVGPTDLTSRAPETASQLFSNNVVSIIRHLSGPKTKPKTKPQPVDSDAISAEDFADQLSEATMTSVTLSPSDEIAAGSVVATGGVVVHPRVRAKLGLDPLATTTAKDHDRSEGAKTV